MILSDLTLTHFRSYAKKTILFSPATTLIIGPNTAGKTNILEAIMLLATGKSFRADRDSEMVAWGGELARVKGVIEDTKLECLITPSIKKYLVNGIGRRQLDFLGNFRAVLFWPEHLELVTDSPGIRRKYLDGVLVQVDREYRRNLQSYERGLRQRNRLLDLINEGKAHRHQLQFWDQLLIKAGGYITDKRGEFIDFINFYKFYKNYNDYTIVYDKSVISESRLDQYKDEEVAAKVTLVGPHRDDFTIFKKENELSKYGSRGEQRLAVLWMKLAELSFIEKATGERPILILDDIFSELDESHRELVLALLDKQQTIVSSAEEEVGELLRKNAIKADTIRL
jgi:DNA replication and repair protein RecF